MSIKLPNFLGVNIAFSFSFILLIVFAGQYPWSAAMPMGGDAPIYIIKARQILGERSIFTLLNELREGWYPLVNALFLPMAILPLSWPHRFIIWAALAQISSGLSLTWLLRRLAGNWTAAAGLAIWAITPITATQHFEDSTIAQLWSYSFLFLFLERWLADRFLPAFFLLLAAALAHPLTGLALFLANVCAIIPLWVIRDKLSLIVRKDLIRFLLVLTALIILTGLVLYYRQRIFWLIKADTMATTLLDHWYSPFGLLMVMMPLGFLELISLKRGALHHLILLLSVSISFVLLGVNHLLNINVWTHRLDPLFIIVLTIMAALGWDRLTAAIFTRSLARVTAFIVLFTTLAAGAWQNNATVYAYYEAPSRYARIHPEELSAIYWLRDHLPSDGQIVTTSVNRHSEWIPALTNFLWYPTSEITSKSIAVDQNFSDSKQSIVLPTYYVFFLHRESIPDDIEKRYRAIYRNRGAAVFKVN